MRRMTYIKHIDGLRALAVLGALFLHLDFSFLSGGYVGVDIFFVISGFLITRLIIEEIHETGTLNFLNFYFRRSVRILPTLFFMVFISWFFGFLLFSPDHFKNIGGQVVSSVLSLSNFYFWSQSGYFDVASRLKPLLNTWTLGAEEQFYLLWPLLLFLVSVRMSRKYLLGFIILVFILSLVLNFLFQKNDLSALYYLMPFRMFELCFGAFMVWIMPYKVSRNVVLEILCLLGTVMLLYPMITYTPNTVFPSYNALIPITGTALVIYAGSAKYLGTLFSNRVSRGLGIISYSLYLVHWPLIVFFTYYFSIALLLAEKLLLVALSLFFATLVHFYIEQPFRKKIPRQQVKAQIQLMLKWAWIAAILLVLGASTYCLDGWPWRPPVSHRKLAEQENQAHLSDFGGTGFLNNGWIYGSNKDSPDLIMMGDSHVQMLSSGIYNEIAVPYHQKTYIASASCLMLPNTSRLIQDFDANTICPNAFHDGLTALYKNPHSVLILSQGWAYQFPFAIDMLSKQLFKINPMSSRYEDYFLFTKRLDQLRALIGTRKLILIGDISGALLVDPKDCLLRPFFKNLPCTKKQRIAENKTQGQVNANSILDQYAKTHKNTYFINPYDILCADGYCPSVNSQGEFYYYDQGHLSVFGSEYLIRNIRPRIMQIMNSKS